MISGHLADCLRRLAVQSHRSDLAHSEGSAGSACALLAEEDGGAVREPRGEPSNQKKWARDDQEDRRDRAVGDPLDEPFNPA